MNRLKLYEVQVLAIIPADRNLEFQTRIRIAAPILVENVLGTAMNVRIRNEEGAETQVSINRGKVKIARFNLTYFKKCAFQQLASKSATLQIQLAGFEWSTPVSLANLEHVTLLDRNRESLRIDTECKDAEGVRWIIFYSKFWILNTTGLELQYQGSNKNALAAGYFEGRSAFELFMFSPSEKWYTGNSQLFIRLPGSPWTETVNINSKASTVFTQLVQNDKHYQLGNLATRLLEFP